MRTQRGLGTQVTGRRQCSNSTREYGGWAGRPHCNLSAAVCPQGATRPPKTVL